MMPDSKVTTVEITPKPISNVAVAALCGEPAEVVRHFINNCLMSGFQEVRIYIDGRADPSLLQSNFTNRVIVCECDDNFWRDTNGEIGRPKFLEQRQRICFEHAYHNTQEVRWIGFCDADEIFVPPKSLDESLEIVPPDIQQVLAETCEVFWDRTSDVDSRFSGNWGRVPSLVAAGDPSLDSCLEKAPYIFRVLSTRGLVGHASGKCFVRTRLEGFSAGNHWHFSTRTGQRIPLAIEKSDISLIHYDAISFSDWKRKHKARVEGRTILGARMDKRRAQTEVFALCGGEAKKRDLFWQLYGSSEDYLLALKLAGLLRKIVRS